MLDWNSFVRDTVSVDRKSEASHVEVEAERRSPRIYISATRDWLEVVQFANDPWMESWKVCIPQKVQNDDIAKIIVRYGAHERFENNESLHRTEGK